MDIQHYNLTDLEIVWALLFTTFAALALAMYAVMKWNKAEDRAVNAENRSYWSVAQLSAYRNLNKDYRALQEQHEQTLASIIGKAVAPPPPPWEDDFNNDILPPPEMFYEETNHPIVYPTAHGTDGHALVTNFR
jgi:hypothetical protein